MCFSKAKENCWVRKWNIEFLLDFFQKLCFMELMKPMLTEPLFILIVPMYCTNYIVEKTGKQGRTRWKKRGIIWGNTIWHTHVWLRTNCGKVTHSNSQIGVSLPQGDRNKFLTLLTAWFSEPRLEPTCPELPLDVPFNFNV